MPELTRSQVAITALVVFVVVFAGARTLGRQGAAATSSGGSLTAPAAPVPAPASSLPVATAAVATAPVAADVVVHVAGEVRRPGVYRLRAGARVADAVQRAGGETRRGDPDAINLAARLTDGQQVLVPRRGSTAVGAAGVGTGAAAAAPSGPVNLNTATAEQLETLDGVGPATAEKILAYRTEHGSFTSVDELAEVPGIGPKKLAALRDAVTV